MIELEEETEKQLPLMIRLIRKFIKSDPIIEKKSEDSDGKL